MDTKEKQDKFEFTEANLKLSEKIISQYPQKRNALMPLLHLAQVQNNNWLSLAVMDYIAGFLSIPPMQVYEVANFYTMYNTKPIGKYLVQICRTTPCWLRGSDEITRACKKTLGIEIGQTDAAKKYTLIEVECLGACVNAPVVQINEKYYENLNEEKIVKVLTSLP